MTTKHTVLTCLIKENFDEYGHRLTN